MNYLKYSVLFATVVLIGSLVTVVFYNNIPFNPVSYKFNAIKQAFSVLPQGWAFFTRSPRESQVIVYQIREDTIFEQEVLRHSYPENGFGLNREQTFKMNELQFIIADLKPTQYTTTTWNYMQHKKGILPDTTFQVSHVFQHSALAGKEILLVFQEIVPWAWGHNNNIMMPAKAVKLKIN